MKITIDPIKVIIADDHEILRDGIVSIIQKHENIQIVAEASNGIQLVQAADEFQPDVILTDIKMPFMDGIEATAIITKKYPTIGILALSMFDDDKLIFDMLEAGAKGYLLKNASRDEIIEAINTVNHLQAYFCKTISLKSMRFIAENRYGKKRKNEIEFTLKERQVIDLICQQFFTKEISEALSLSPRTIEGYRETILRKINARNSIGIVLYAIENNMYTQSNADNKNQ